MIPGLDPQLTVASGNLAAALLVAAAAGFVSFASPCVLPLVPGYLSYMSGLSGAEVDAGASGRSGSVTARVTLAALLFVVGFSLVFVALGAALGGLTSWLIANREPVTRVAGVLVIALGLFMAGLVKAPWLYRERRVRADRVPAGLAGALPLGMVFGLGWTPCIGPTLGAILTLSINEATVARGALLSGVYALGLGLPFVLAGLAYRRALGAFGFVRRHQAWVTRLGGVMLVLVGVLLVTGWWDQIVSWVQVQLVSDFEVPV